MVDDRNPPDSTSAEDVTPRQNKDGDVNFPSTTGSDITSGTPTENEVQGEPPIPRDVYDQGDSNVGEPKDDAHAR